MRRVSSSVASSGTVSTTNTAATLSNQIYLVVQNNEPRGTSLIIVSRTQPAFGHHITMTLDEYRTFRLYMFHLIRILKFGTLVRNIDTLKTALYFLYADIARLVAPTLSEHEQLKQTALALYPSNVTIPPGFYQSSNSSVDTTTWKTPGCHFFDASRSHKINSLLHPLLNAALNAVEELTTIKQIVEEKTNPDHRNILLSTKGTANIDHLQHLNIQRTGTSLQLALYSGDEDVVHYLKTVMDPAEFEYQSKEVFRNALLPEKQAELDAKNTTALDYYHAMLEVQTVEAEKLCMDSQEVTDTTAASFQEKLIAYVRNNPMHNPYILYHLYKIYEELSNDNFAQHALFSQKAIGLAHALSPARWLQHYSQGISYLRWPEQSLRSFQLRNSNPAVDVRSFIPASLGVDSFMCVFAPQSRHARSLRGVPYARMHDGVFWKFLSSKNSKLAELVTQPGASLQAAPSIANMTVLFH